MFVNNSLTTYRLNHKKTIPSYISNMFRAVNGNEKFCRNNFVGFFDC